MATTIITVKQMKEMLDQYDDALEITDKNGDALTGMEESEYTEDGIGYIQCLMLEFTNDA